MTERVPLVAATATQTIPRVERTRRRRGRRFVGIALLLVAIAAIAWGAWVYVVPHHAGVPQLIGHPIDDARAQLIDSGFQVVVADAGVYRMNIPKDDVAIVRPAAGTSLQKGATVTLIPSLGPPLVRVPNIVGMTLTDATKAVEKAHLVLGQPKQVYSDQPIGQILSQSADGTAPRGSPIDVTISQGPKPIPLPDVVGKTQDEATQLLTSAGFLVVPQTKFSTDVPRGAVIRQSPPAQKALQPGQTVTITVSLGPKHFAVPDFSGLTRDGAQALADQYGLAIDFQVIGTTPGTIVFSQNPGVGVTVNYGDTITLYLV